MRRPGICRDLVGIDGKSSKFFGLIQNLLVLDLALHLRDQNVMVDLVKELLQVHIHDQAPPYDTVADKIAIVFPICPKQPGRF
jgi:hypothetical protein